MAAAGWYPDPSGQPGAFRYWDGDVWSEAHSVTLDAAPDQVRANEDALGDALLEAVGETARGTDIIQIVP
ncbi:MAG: DUF2510 domain-containing protein, partial [Nocardioides sp.]|uniref:DUF2510 domain-containing protein n=1 Tax=Nocardioides sp. TaxID=35761 RepID=UPI0023943672